MLLAIYVSGHCHENTILLKKKTRAYNSIHVLDYKMYLFLTWESNSIKHYDSYCIVLYIFLFSILFCWTYPFSFSFYYKLIVTKIYVIKINETGPAHKAQGFQWHIAYSFMAQSLPKAQHTTPHHISRDETSRSKTLLIMNGSLLQRRPVVRFFHRRLGFLFQFFPSSVPLHFSRLQMLCAGVRLQPWISFGHG